MKAINSVFLFFILITTIHSYSQCPDVSIELKTQNDIDMFSINYPNCTELTSDLFITGSSNVSNLEGLNNISKIDGLLYVSN